MPGTDLHSPAGIRPKFGHSLEHIVLRKKPPPPGKETGAGGVAAPLRGPAPPARAQVDGFGLSKGESPRLAALRNNQLLGAGGVPEARLVPRGGEPNGRRSGGGAVRRREELARRVRRRRAGALRRGGSRWREAAGVGVVQLS